jgi:hypothetical protein
MQRLALANLLQDSSTNRVMQDFIAGTSTVVMKISFMDQPHSTFTGCTVVLVNHCGKIMSADEGYMVSLWQWIGCLS